MRIIVQIVSALILCMLSLTAPVLAEDEDLAPRDQLSIFAAASLADVLPDLIHAWDSSHKQDASPKMIFGPSATLARQITLGAPADIFLSANPHWSSEIAKSLKTTQAPVMIAGNSLVLVGNKSIYTTATGSADLETLIGTIANAPRLAIANPATAPAGEYAHKFLHRTGQWDALQGKLALGNSVRQALLYAERSNMLAIVYATDAVASNHVHILGNIPKDMSGVITYSATNVTNRMSGQDFIAFLKSSAAGKIWASHGFTLPE
ncbi:molybdate ABC transporter substrate-binding protein [Kordiimonas sediminis]|uniref:Molybdate ABC transporter substrate-binding protein n=2 Tax=Kordiimonas sediminis TaxID=1735581 RepID=A0A919ARB7_9PROT|nr:molybdate ABC transporter substrate-binding protein [Kordiimonas sediminis]